MSSHVKTRVFLNRYNALDNYLRDLIGVDDSRGMISIYKDTVDSISEQQMLKTMNKLRNDIAHGVFPSDDSLKIDSEFCRLLDKHLLYVKFHKKLVKEKMLKAMKERQEKDEAKQSEVTKTNEPVKTNNRVMNNYVEPNINVNVNTNHSRQKKNRNVQSSASFRNIVIENWVGTIEIFCSNSFSISCSHQIANDTLFLTDQVGTAEIGIPAGNYEGLWITNVTGTISIDSNNIRFNNIYREDHTGTLDY